MALIYVLVQFASINLCSPDTSLKDFNAIFFYPPVEKNQWLLPCKTSLFGCLGCLHYFLRPVGNCLGVIKKTKQEAPCIQTIETSLQFSHINLSSPSGIELHCFFAPFYFLFLPSMSIFYLLCFCCGCSRQK